MCESRLRIAPDAAEIRSLREKLNRQTYELQQHYETLMASDVLANLAGQRPPSHDERPRMSGRSLHYTSEPELTI